MDSITIHHWEVPIHHRKNKRAKRLSMKIDSAIPQLVVTSPFWTPRFMVNRFVQSQYDWIFDRWNALQKKLSERPLLEHSPAYYKAKAKVLIRDRLEHYNQFYNLDYNRVFFKNQKTRWGSCSSQRNLNFNWRLVLAPLEVLDYVVVHELCHLLEMNHSSDFWALVEQQIPDHKKWRRWLRENHLLLTL